MDDVTNHDCVVPVPMSHPKVSFASLFEWVETFQTLDNHLKYEDLLEQAFLFEVLHQIDSRPTWVEPVNCANDPASQIHNASVLFIQLITCYMDCLNQAVALPMLDIAVLINYRSELSASQQEMQKILLLILGLAIQSDRKDDFISVMETLSAGTKGDIMESYKELSGHLVRLDSRDDSGALRKCCEDRLAQFKKYSRALQEKHYLEAVVLSAQNFAGPDLLKSLRPPDGLMDFHGYQLLLGSANQQAASFAAQLEDRAAEAAQLAAALMQKREKVKRLKAQLKNLSVSEHAVRLKNAQDENDRLKESLKAYDDLEHEARSLRQRFAEFDFYKARVQELRDENSQLLEERQRAEEDLAALRAHSDATVERLAESQLRCDELVVQRDAEAKQAAASANRLAAENRRLREVLDALGGGGAHSVAASFASAAAGAAAVSTASAPSLAAELAVAVRIRDLDSEVQQLTLAEASARNRADELTQQLQRLMSERAEARAKATADLAVERRAASELKLRAERSERRVQELLASQAESEAAGFQRCAAEYERRAAEQGQRIQGLLVERELLEATANEESMAERTASESERRAVELERRLLKVLAERADADAAASAEVAGLRRAASESQHRAAELERRLQRLLVERAEAAESAATAAATEAEAELVLQTSQELARHLARLGENNRALRQSCEKLRAELNRLSDVELEVTQLREARLADAGELQQLLAQNRQLRRALDSPKTPPSRGSTPSAPKAAAAVAGAAPQSAGRSRSSTTAPTKRPVT